MKTKQSYTHQKMAASYTRLNKLLCLFLMVVGLAANAQQLSPFKNLPLGNSVDTVNDRIVWMHWDGSKWVDQQMPPKYLARLISSGTLSGSGTHNFIPLWNSSTTLGNSIMQQNSFGIRDSNYFTLTNNAKAAFYMDSLTSVATPPSSHQGLFAFQNNGYLFESHESVSTLGVWDIELPQTVGAEIFDFHKITGNIIHHFPDSSGTVALLQNITGGFISGLTTNTIPIATSSTTLGNGPLSVSGSILTSSDRYAVPAVNITGTSGAGVLLLNTQGTNLATLAANQVGLESYAGAFAIQMTSVSGYLFDPLIGSNSIVFNPVTVTGTRTYFAPDSSGYWALQHKADASSLLYNALPSLSTGALTWNGSAWAFNSTYATVGGSNTQIQYNNSGSLAGSSNNIYTDGVTEQLNTTSGTGTRGLQIYQSSTDAHGPKILFKKERGTLASPTTIAAGDTAMHLSSASYTGSTWYNDFRLISVVKKVSTAGTGSYIDLFTSSILNGSTNKLHIDSAGIFTASGYGTGIIHSSSVGLFTSSAVNLANSDVTGDLPIANGGNNNTSYTSGTFIYNNGTSNVSAPMSYTVGTGGIVTTVAIHPDSMALPVHTSAYTPKYIGEQWISRVGGDTSLCIYHGGRTSEVDSTTLNILGIAWTPSFTGFSVAPSVTSARYWLIGRSCYVVLITGTGTSNSTGFTVTLPLKAAYSQYITPSDMTNNSVGSNSNGALLSTGSTTCTMLLTNNSTGWVSSGTKSAQLGTSYIIQ